jgi:NAD(P)-dependent dehydrogenase (short-subunit alcohol dehydrogenase family)
MHESGALLQGNGAIVTGSASGIGLGIARSLARTGANVMLNGYGDERETAALPAVARAQSGGITVEQARIELLSEKQPSREFATPEQIGALAVFLCSNDAAQIRGAALPVDGGWLAQ